jgi:predicted nucleotidyltransferase
VTSLASSTSFWRRLRTGPWGKPVVERVEAALDAIVRRLRTDNAIRAIVLFGSYSRGDFGRRSDIDLLVLIESGSGEQLAAARERAIEAISEVESEARLPMHIAPLVADARDVEGLGETLLHEVWTDGIVLYGEASSLAGLRPEGLAAWSVVRFSLQGTLSKERVRLARRLHGAGGKPGIIRLPGLNLARGAAMLPAEQARAVRAALDDAGATYDIIPVWRDVGTKE